MSAPPRPSPSGRGTCDHRPARADGHTVAADEVGGGSPAARDSAGIDALGDGVAPGWLATAVLVAHVVTAQLDLGVLGVEGALDQAVRLVVWVLPVVVLLTSSRTLHGSLWSGPQRLASAWLLWGVASALWSISPTQSIVQGVSVASLWLVSHWFVRRHGWTSFLRVTVLAGSAFLVLGLVWDLAGLAPADSSSSTEGRLTGLTFGATNLGRYAALTALLAVALAQRDRGGRRIAAVALPVTLVALLASGTRTSLVVLLAVGILAVGRSRGRAAARQAGVAAVGLLLALWPVLITGATTTARLGDTSTVSSLNGRDQIFSVAVELWSQRPLLGWGMGTNTALWDEAARSGMLSWRAFTAHNTMLDLAVSLGLIGVVLFAAALWTALVRAGRADDPWPWLLILATVGLGLTEATVHRPGFTLVVLGGAVATVVADRGAVSAVAASRRAGSSGRPVTGAPSRPARGSTTR